MSGLGSINWMIFFAGQSISMISDLVPTFQATMYQIILVTLMRSGKKLRVGKVADISTFVE